MTYSITQLFDLIDQPKDKGEFYYGCSGNFGTDYYLNRITGFRPDEIRILWGYDDENPVVGLDKARKVICVDDNEIILFLYNSHNEDFIVERMVNIEAALEFMYSKEGLKNEFWGDVSIIRGGKRQKYCVKDSAGKTITWKDIAEGSISQKEAIFKIELV